MTKAECDVRVSIEIRSKRVINIFTDGTIHNFFGMESLRRHKFSHEIHFSDSVNDSCIHV